MFGNFYTAKNGREGLELYRKYLPDIVVTDIQMPEMNGLSMAADIRSINPEQAIVILSAYNDVEIYQPCCLHKSIFRKLFNWFHDLFYPGTLNCPQLA